MAGVRSQVRVVLEDAPIHCIDILDTTGARVLRIRPASGGGVTLSTEGPPAASLTVEDVRELADAIGRLAR